MASDYRGIKLPPVVWQQRPWGAGSLDISEVAFHFDMNDLRREAEAAALQFGASERDQAKAMAYLSSPEAVQRREAFFAGRRLLIHSTGKVRC
jgi:hypothetical protein